ncbi:MAG: nucleotidyltransferase domain-containing protein [Microscillaceae bacterium]|nr:nucleotidyltransferase domain-containing protein [Microscillaceae bacterium]
MRERIIEALEKLEKDQEIKVLYACESGSRAWGFPSPDSDYDVRFIYAQSPKRYLSIYDRKDAIDLFLAEDLDFIGWDVRKALRLFHKSNASPYEWMQSSIVYKEVPEFINPLRQLAATYFSGRTSLHHYIGMAKHTYLGHLQGEQVRIKNIFMPCGPCFVLSGL